jgi:four helix bundle protein
MEHSLLNSSKSNPLVEKSYLFSIKIIKSFQNIQKEQKEFILSKQFIRSGTSIGALIFEGQFAQSQADFVNKLSISLKEANETKYWIFLLKDTGYIDNQLFESLISDVNELINMLVCSIKTVKSKMNNK